ncbi:MAG TPA: tetratricopeptide repeat protein, partial [Xanthobacteraceae bacterium]|nr:tetratricopeptide repeat protein [Xanthobacteraceae bacterium]
MVLTPLRRQPHYTTLDDSTFFIEPHLQSSEHQPKPASSALEQAVTLHRAGRLDEAEQHYLAILQADPHHFDALHLLGLVRHKQGRSAEAAELIGTALKIKVTVDVLLNYAAVLEQLGRFDDALSN